MNYLLVDNTSELVNEIYNILAECGRNMYENDGLTHWKNPYPLENIKSDCNKNYVYIGNLNGKYVNTFQLNFEGSNCIITKFATSPSHAGKGIGKQSMEYIKMICREKNTETITLDVYDKSQTAISFYRRLGFDFVGSKSTKYFTVLTMKMNVTSQTTN